MCKGTDRGNGFMIGHVDKELVMIINDLLRESPALHVRPARHFTHEIFMKKNRQTTYYDDHIIITHTLIGTPRFHNKKKEKTDKYRLLRETNTILNLKTIIIITFKNKLYTRILLGRIDVEHHILTIVEYHCLTFSG